MEVRILSVIREKGVMVETCITVVTVPTVTINEHGLRVAEAVIVVVVVLSN